MADIAQVRFFTSRDADPQALQGEHIAVLGYGNLGRPFALNLRDSGVTEIVIGNIEDDYARAARAEGFTVLPLDQAIRAADLVLVLLSDEIISEIFAPAITPHLQPGSAIVFASGYNLAYDLIQPPEGIDVLMLAPRMAGENARQRFLDGRGFYAYVSVEQDVSGKAWRRLLGLAGGVGVLRAGAMQLDARREADLDLLVEQTLGSVLGVAILSIFALGVEAGIPAEAMVMEMYYSEEMESVWRAFREQGFMLASNAHGPTALYGGFIQTMKFLNSNLPQTFRSTLAEIQSGEFAQHFQAERQAGYPVLSQAFAMIQGEDPVTQAEARLRGMLASAREM
jgi:ketol-acid reductoisomerase